MKRILVVDVGGTNIKVMISRRERRKIDSGSDFTPRDFAREMKRTAREWKFDAVSVGFPSPCADGRILKDPKNLGPGWTRVDFRKVFAKPVRVINDAAMQALGSYHGGRMLFLGLGTGLGSALVYDNTVLGLELGDLPYLDNGTVEDRLGKAGLKRIGRARWVREAKRVVAHLKSAMVADYVVLGGGNSKLMPVALDGVELGHNRNAYTGGMRLWQSNGRRRRWTII